MTRDDGFHAKQLAREASLFGLWIGKRMARFLGFWRTIAGFSTKPAMALHLTLGIVLILCGMWLFPRPLLAVVVVIVAACVALAIAGLLAARSKSPSKKMPWLRGLGVVAAILGIAGLFFLRTVALILPFLTATLLLALSAYLLFHCLKPGSRARRTINAVALLIVSVVCFFWPDLLQLAIGSIFAILLLLAGVYQVVLAFRRSTRSRRSPRSADAPTKPGRLKTFAAWTTTVVFLCASLLLGGATVALHTATPAPDPFYSWNQALPSRPGTLLRTEKYRGVIPAGSQALKILYSTTYSDGTPALASAVVSIPDAPSAQPRLVLAWQHGTTGVTQACGPSVGTEALTNLGIPGIDTMMSKGWVVVATDYPGQGTAGRYPYLVGQGEGRATLDAIRAVKHLKEADASSEAMIWGHSQGGHATLWAGQIASGYAPELKIRGVAALSAASNPLTLAETVTSHPTSPAAALITSFVLVPYTDEYSDVEFKKTVHPAGQVIVSTMAQRCLGAKQTLASVLDGTWAGAASPLYNLDLSDSDNPQGTPNLVRNRLAENIATGMVNAPLFLGQGQSDEVIPIKIQRELNSKVCAAGKAVSTHEYPDRTHMGVIAPDSPLIGDLFAWSDAVLAGKQPSTCGA